MGAWGIQIQGDGPGDYAQDGLGAAAEQAIAELCDKLTASGLEIGFAAVLAPNAEQQSDPANGTEVVTDLTAGPASLPFKCPECGRQFPAAATCAGGEYGHPPVQVLPTEQVHAGATVANPAPLQPAPAPAPAPAPPPPAAAPEPAPPPPPAAAGVTVWPK